MTAFIPSMNLNCDICNKDFSGIESANQHYASVAHKKKVENVKNPSCTGVHGRAFCEECKIFCDTKLQLDMHKSSPKHNVVVEKLKRQQQDDMRKTFRFDDGDCSPTASPPRGTGSQQQEYVFDGERGQCFICSLQLTSKAHAKQHLEGKKHKKAQTQHIVNTQILSTPSPPIAQNPQLIGTNYLLEVEKEYVFEGMAGWCYLCRVDLSSTKQAKDHLTGQKHLKMKKKWEEMKQFKSRDWSNEATTSSPPRQGINSAMINEDACPNSNQCDICQKFYRSAAMLKLHKELHKNEDSKKMDEHKREKVGDSPMKTTEALPLSNYNSSTGQKIKPRFNYSRFEEGQNLSDITVVKTGETFSKQTKKDESLGLSFLDDYNTPKSSLGLDDLRNKSGIDELLKLDSNSGNRESLGIQPEVQKSLPSEDVESKMDSLCSLINDIDISQDGTSEYLQDAGLPLATGNNECFAMRCTYHCPVCDVHCNGDGPKKQHFLSKKHDKQEQKVRQALQKRQIDGSENPFPTFHSYCDICMVPFNNDESERTHKEGRQHMAKVAKSDVGKPKELPPVNSYANEDDCIDVVDHLTKTIARTYQVELYEKAMQKDTVCFLPTGTGKTLVSAMVMSHMLRLNPHRPVIFLVDRILLVIQQSQFLKKELEEFDFERWDSEASALVKRKLRIATLCRGQQQTQGMSLYQQDLIIMTAAYYVNLLNEEVHDWSLNCLVVFDEAHHCTKDHPFNKLLKDYHLKLPPSNRPKILGLTASPAGKSTIGETKIMLTELLSNMGGADITMVVKEMRVLKKYQSHTELIVKEVSLNAQEFQAMNCLQSHLQNCYTVLNQLVSLQDFEHHQEFKKVAKSKEIPGRLLTQLNTALIYDLLDFLQAVEVNDRSKKIHTEALIWHLKQIANSMISLRTLGIRSMFDEIQPLLDEKMPGNIANMADSMSIECTEVKDLIERIREIIYPKGYAAIEMGDLLGDQTSQQRFDPDMMPAIKQLITELTKNISWGKGQNQMALVLLRKRQDAMFLTKVLKQTSFVEELSLQVICVTGHGESNKDGMSVKKQSQILNEIQEKKYHIIVATSVAEEGLDLPECELVIQMDPPKNVTALVQIRGRARKKSSRFIALCRCPDQKRSVEDLLQREQNMMKAITIISQERPQETPLV